MGEENKYHYPTQPIDHSRQGGEEVKEATLEKHWEMHRTCRWNAFRKDRVNAKVNLTLKGTNNLGSIELGKGSTITLKPETAGKDMNEKLSISSVRNGGSFTDETATVSLVKIWRIIR